MKCCTNKICPALHCARQLVSKTETCGETHYTFMTFDNPTATDLVSTIDGKQVGFSCTGYLLGKIA